jgi:hypothetical protein
MQSKATSPENYLNELPEDRKEPMMKLRWFDPLLIGQF